MAVSSDIIITAMLISALRRSRTGIKRSVLFYRTLGGMLNHRQDGLHAGRHDHVLDQHGYVFVLTVRQAAY